MSARLTGGRAAVAGIVVAALMFTTAGPAQASGQSTLLSRAEVLALAERMAAEATGDSGEDSAAAPTAPSSTSPSGGDPVDAADNGDPTSQVMSQLTDPLRMIAQTAQEPDGTLTAGTSTTITAADLGIDVTFSGHEVTADLSVRIDDLPGATTGAPGARVARAAKSTSAATGLPDDAIVLVEPFEVVARDAEGNEVTSFPTQSVQVPRDGEDIPVTDTDFVPGVVLNVPVDGARTTEVDTGSVRLYTRETDADQWEEVASYLDSESGAVYGELDHLSQFVVIGSPFVPDPTPRIVLDPDNDIANTVSPSGKVTELPFNIQLATQTSLLFGERCHADVLVTRSNPAQTTLSQAVRAGMAAAWNPDLTVTLAFDAVKGHPWGTEGDGGSKIYPGDGPHALAAADSLNNQLPGYTGRPSKLIGSAVLPYDDFRPLPGAVVHLETLNLDHNYDWPVIQNGMQYIANGVFTGLGMYLESQGFNCNDPKLGGWPDRPSQEELDRWRNLGHHNFQTYGADPVSFSTGNLIEDEPLFTLSGPGGSETDLTLTYNSQDGRLTRTGAGWSFDLGGRAQRFADGGVMVVRGDGASFMYEPDGAGGFTADPGNTSRLHDLGDGRVEQIDADGTRRVYDTSDIEGIGELVSVTDRQGHTTTLGYGAADADDQFLPLTSITDAAGQTIQVHGDALGRVGAFVLPDGRAWSLGYDGAGNLVQITNPDGRTRTFTYDDAHRMTSATDALGVTYLRNAFDAAGRVVEQWDADGNRRTWQFSDEGDSRGLRSVVYTDNEGRKSTYRYDQRYRIVEVVDAAGRTQTYEYDQADRITRKVDENGRATGYTYDAAGNVLTETAADGSVQSWTYDAHGEVTSHTDSGGQEDADRTTAWGLSDRGLTESVAWADGTTATAGYDAQGNLTSVTDAAGQITRYEYDARGNQIAEVDPLGARTTFEYDASNRMTAMVEANGARTEYRWDAGDRLVEEIDALGGVSRISYDGNDHPVSITDANGATTSLTWDNLFRITSVTDATGATTSYEYTAEDELVSVTDPMGAVVRYELDDADRVTAVTDPNGGVWTQTYDEAGNVVAQTSPSGAVTEYTYDELGRELSVTDPTGGTWAKGYDTVGRVVAEVDPTGGVTQFHYDLNDQVVRITDPLGHTIEYGYDAVGNQISRTDRRGQTWSSSYDANGRLISETDPLGVVTSYAYDLVGNLTSITDALDAVTSYGYDLLGRAVSETDPLGGVRTAEYDAVGQPTRSVDATGAATSYAYDPVGRVTSITDGVEALTSYAYDAAGRQISTTDPNGTVTAYAYDAAGQLTGVTEAAEGTVQNAADVGPVETTYSYDEDGRLLSILNGRDFATTFGYDAAGRVTSETDATGRTWSYRYDLAGRLTTETDAAGRHTNYAYDDAGNLTRRSVAGQHIEYAYDNEQQLISMDDGLGVTAWGYDELGRMTQQVDTEGATLNYSYDALGQVTELGLPAGDTIAATFDAAGRMTGQTTPWGELAYTWDAEHRLLSTERTEADGAEGVTTTVAYDAVGRVATVAHLTPGLPSAETADADSVEGTTSVVDTSTTLPWRAEVTPTVGSADADASSGTATCTSSGSYLTTRTVPEGGAGTRCHAATDYLAAREVPTAEPVADNGRGVRYDYTYDAADNVTSEAASIGQVPAAGVALDDEAAPLGPLSTVTTTHAYDALSRLRESSSTAGEVSQYTYDETNNLTSWSTTTDQSQTTWESHFDGANRLTSASVRDGERAAEVSYSLDANGSRVAGRVSGDPLLTNGLSMSATYGADGKIASYTANGATTSYEYDGLGRAVSTATTESSGTVETSWAFDGLNPVAGSTSTGADVALVRDSLGALALQSDQQLAGTQGGSERWALVDALGSVVAQASAASGAASINELTMYDDYGVADQATSGWGASLGYSGQMVDLSTGGIAYYQRMYDPLSGTWTAQDAWSGLLEVPGSLNGFAFLYGNPTSMIDVLGFAGMLIDGQWGSPGAFAAAKKSRQPQFPILEPIPAFSDAIDELNGSRKTVKTIHKGVTKTLKSAPKVRDSESARHGGFWNSIGGWWSDTWQGANRWWSDHGDVVLAGVGIVLGIACIVPAVGLACAVAGGVMAGVNFVDGLVYRDASPGEAFGQLGLDLTLLGFGAGVSRGLGWAAAQSGEEVSRGVEIYGNIQTSLPGLAHSGGALINTGGQ
ncbi:RHS repeat-associated core domain-containing protein [Cellulomonas sp. NPDC089187]|uniref:RHS repeat-associated core domain-containing protein n=1 Tax=Cellulomonas sp. NPDC089187 TaxID=3154970 RepID=UPI0034154583